MSAVTSAIAVVLISMGGELTGRVEKADGSPSIDAKVIAVRMTFSASISDRETVRTNQSGEFSLNLPDDVERDTTWLVLVLDNNDYGTLDRVVNVPQRRHDGSKALALTAEPVIIRLRPGKSISGTVFHQVTRKPLPLARIYTHQGQLVRADQDGRFELRGVPSGVESLFVVSPGKVKSRVFVDVSERAHANIEISLAPAVTIVGTVVDERDRPVPGALIQPMDGSRLFSAIFTARSDHEGRFELDGFPIKMMLLPFRVTAPGHDERNDEMFCIRDIDRPYEMTLRMITVKPGDHGLGGLRNALAADEPPPTGAIRGRVVDSQGNPVRNFAVKLLPSKQKEPRDHGSWSLGTRHFTQPTGRFVIGTLDADKRYAIGIEAPGFGRAVIDPIYARTAASMKDADELEFRLGQPHQLQVRVVDADFRQPIPDIQVGFSDEIQPSTEFSWNYRLRGSQLEWTDRTGVASFKDLAASEGLVFVQQAGFARTKIFWNNSPEVTEGKADPIDVPLTRECKLNVKLIEMGDRDPGAFYYTVVTSANEHHYSDRPAKGKSFTIPATQLPPGKHLLTLFDSTSREPWTPVAKREIELQAGDSEIELKPFKD